MVIKSFTHKKNIYSKELKSNSYYSGRIGFWGEVSDVDSINGWCSVINDQGQKYNSIPVYSRQWVIDNKDYVSGERKLPPVGARVFVLVPTENVSSAFILCSGYPEGEKSLRTIFAKNNDEKNIKANQYESISQSGWNIKENYEDGNVTFTSKDEKIIINANLSKNNNLSQEQEIKITAWNNIITLNSDGLSLEDSNSNKINASSEGITIQDSNNNKIDMTSSSVKINGNLEVLK